MHAVKPDHQLLRFSIFYNRDEQHFLISDFVKPLYQKLKDSEPGIVLVLYFNNQNGENVGFNWLISSYSIKQLSKIIHKEALLFLKTKPSVNSLRLYTSTALFMDFPVNSLQYNISRFPAGHLQQLPSSYIVNITATVTDILLKMADDDTLDSETVITLAVYFVGLLIKAFFAVVEESLPVLRTLLKTDEDYALIIPPSNDLQELVCEILGDELAKDSDSWITSWYIICKDISALAPKEVDKATIINLIASLVIEQLGLAPSVQQAILFNIVGVLTKRCI